MVETYFRAFLLMLSFMHNDFRYEGSLPDLFREGHSVVVEGFVRKFEEDGVGKVGHKVSEKARKGDCYFKATEVLAKHDEKYMPAEVAAAIEKNKKQIEAEAKAAAGAVPAVGAVQS